METKLIFKNKNIFITGGTGSFGNQMVEYLIKQSPKKIIIYSRDEMKQWFMREKFKNFRNIKFVVGDIRDVERLSDAMYGSQFVIHAAATKIVPTAEINPEECIKTNVIGAMNLIRACKDNNIKKVIALSTDKASSPINLYGASKLCSDKLITSQINKDSYTKFSVVRYGNVLGSRGSVIPYFLSLKNSKYLPITHKDMTRFFISLEDAVKFVAFAFKNMTGGEIFVKKLDSINICKLAKSINSKAKFKYIGIREGEKIHEQMIGVDDSEFTLEYKSHYEIVPNIELKQKKLRNKNCISVKKNFFYSSELTKEIKKEKLLKEINIIRLRENF
tara:strand:- start:734 stop:1729 length:996 start_codon:yes stop_codon:yes gene_type:complete